MVQRQLQKAVLADSGLAALAVAKERPDASRENDHAPSARSSSVDAVRDKLRKAILYIERNPGIVKSITSFPYIAKSF